MPRKKKTEGEPLANPETAKPWQPWQVLQDLVAELTGLGLAVKHAEMQGERCLAQAHRPGRKPVTVTVSPVGVEVEARVPAPPGEELTDAVLVMNSAFLWAVADPLRGEPLAVRAFCPLPYERGRVGRLIEAFEADVAKADAAGVKAA